MFSKLYQKLEGSAFPALVVALFVLAPVTFAGGYATLTGTGGGALFDAPSRSIRGVVGLTGSWYLGPSLVNDLDFASLSPDGRLAVAVRADALYLVSDLDQGTPSLRKLEVGSGMPTRVFWSDDSSTAVLFSCSDRCRTTRIQNARTSPIAETLDLGLPDGPATALAADGAAERIAVSIRSSSEADLYLVSCGSSPELCARLEEPAAAVFSHDGRTLYVADRQARQVLRFESFDDQVSVSPFLSEADGVTDPVALATSSDGAHFFVVELAERKVRVYDSETRLLAADLDIEADPSVVTRFSATSLLLNGERQTGEPILVLQTEPEPRIIFMPAGD